MKVKFEVKNGKFRFFILNRVLKLVLFIDHAKYKATSSEKCKKKTFQQMAPLNNANFKVSPLVALRRVRITAIAVLLVFISIFYRLQLSLIHISEPTRRTPISYAVFC